MSIVTARKRSLGQGNGFTPVCHSVHRGGGQVSAPLHAGIHPPGRQPYPLGRHPRPLDTMGYGQHAGGTYPIGMHTCLNLAFPQIQCFPLLLDLRNLGK